MTGDDKFFAETDLQWNVILDLNEPRYEKMVHQDKELISLTHSFVTYGFRSDRMVDRLACIGWMSLKEENERIIFEMEATAVAGGSCLHRDSVANVVLQEETDADIKIRDDLFFKNLAALESTLTLGVFNKKGIEGHWQVRNEDLYASKSRFRSFFMSQDKNEEPAASVVFKIRDYDMVGPAEFHEDRSLDKLRNDKYDHPFFELRITFTMATSKQDNLMLVMMYPLEDRHLLINQVKRSFRS